MMTLDDMARLWRAGKTTREIAALAGLSRSAVRQRLARAGVRVGMGRRERPAPWYVLVAQTPEERAVAQVLAAGVAVEEIPAIVGYAPDVVAAALEALRRSGHAANDA